MLSRKSGLETEDDCRDLGIEGYAGHSSSSVMRCGALAQWLRRSACSYLYEVGGSVCLAFSIHQCHCAHLCTWGQTVRFVWTAKDATATLGQVMIEDARNVSKFENRELGGGGD